MARGRSQTRAKSPQRQYKTQSGLALAADASLLSFDAEIVDREMTFGIVSAALGVLCSLETIYGGLTPQVGLFSVSYYVPFVPLSVH